MSKKLLTVVVPNKTRTTETLAVLPNSGQTCDEGAKAEGFCGPNLLYDEEKAENKCVLAGSCDGANKDDTNACCKATEGEECKNRATDVIFCGSKLLVYDEKKKNNKCRSASCDADVIDDTNACCSQKEVQLRSSKGRHRVCGCRL